MFPADYSADMIKGFHHAGVATRDLPRLVGFYVEQFHAQVLQRHSWDETDSELSVRFGIQASSGRLAMLGFPDPALEIFQFDKPELPGCLPLRSVAKPGLSHICFEVDDCFAEYYRLSAGGMNFHAAPFAMPAGGVFTYGRDPDGNVVELLQRPPD